MYIIEYTKNGKTYTIHDPRLANNLDINAEGQISGWAKYGASAAKLTQAVNSAGSLTFTVQPEHNAVAALAAMEGIVKVLDIEGASSETVFTGRIFRRSRTFYNAVSCECEGALAFLNDRIAGKYTKTATASEHMTALLRQQSKITMGNCTVTNSATFENDDVSKSVWTALVDDLTGNFGGYIIPRYDGDTVYIDYLKTITAQSSQAVEFAVNLLDVTDEQDGSGMYNLVQPYGADDLMILSIANGWYNRAGEKVAEGASDAVYYKQGGYVLNAEDRDRYGEIAIGYENTEMTTAAELFADAIAKLNGGGAMPRSIRISAVDLSNIESGKSPFRLATVVQVNSTPHGLSVTYPLTEMEINLLDPAKSTLTLGQTADTVSGAVAGGSSGSSGGGSSPVTVYVTSVNGQTGDVTGAQAVDGAAITPASVNVGGAVSLTETTDGRGVLTVYNASGTTMVKAYANSGTAGGEVDVHNTNGTATAKLYGGNSGVGGSLKLLNTSGGIRAAVGVSTGGQGVVELYDTSGNAYTLTPAKIGQIGPSLTLLWTNPNWNTNFAAQTVSLNLSGYTAIMTVFAYATSVKTRRGTQTQLVDGATYTFEAPHTSVGNYWFRREVTASTTGVTFGTGGYFEDGSFQGGNLYTMPLYIYGIK